MTVRHENNVEFDYKRMEDTFYYELEKQVNSLLGSRYGIQKPNKCFHGFGFLPKIAKFVDGCGQLYGDVMGSNGYGYTISIMWRNIKDPSRLISPSDKVEPGEIEFFIDEILSEDKFQEYIKASYITKTITKKQSGYMFDIKMYMYELPDIHLGIHAKSVLSFEEQTRLEDLLWACRNTWNESEEKKYDFESIDYVGKVENIRGKQYKIHIDFGTCTDIESIGFFFNKINESFGERITKITVR